MQCSCCEQPHHGTTMKMDTGQNPKLTSKHARIAHFTTERNVNVILSNLILQGNYMSQTTAIGICDPGEALSPRLCLYLNQLAFPKLHFCHCPTSTAIASCPSAWPWYPASCARRMGQMAPWLQGRWIAYCPLILQHQAPESAWWGLSI